MLPMKTLSVKVTDSVAKRLTKRAGDLGTTQSEIVRRAIEKELSGNHKSKTCGELMEELGGFFEGPPDLSTNPKYMEGFGR